MNQKRSKKRFMQDFHLRKPLCAAMILCSWLVISPATSMAADGIAITQNVNQQITVKGTVLDVNGEPIIGASIAVKGGTSGTITDLDGHFSLSAPTKAQLVVSFIGYESQIVTAKAGESLKIVLKEDTKVLDEVVVVGYGTVKRANLTGAVSDIKMKQFEDIPATSLASVLMGTMPGVSVNEATGNPIANATISIRTKGTWTTEQPLFVIDGFIRDADAFNILDPSEIDNISILKDASAAVYGVRGAAGVILVTTKKGKENKTSINYSGSVGFSQAISMPEMMSAYEQGRALNDMWTEEIRNGGDPKNYNMFALEELEDMKSLDYNWLDDAWKNALNTRHTLNVDGGNEKLRYFVGGSYLYSNGNFSNLDISRLSVRSGLDVKFTKEFKASFNMSYSSRQTEMPLNNKDKQADLMYGTFNDLNRMPRWIPAYIDGKPVGNGLTSSDTHPMEIMNSGSHKKSKGDDIALSAKFDYDFKWVKGLSANVSVNYSRSYSSGKQLSKPYTVYNFENKTYMQNGESVNGHLVSDVLSGTTLLQNGNKYENSANDTYSYQINPQVNYNRSFGKNDISAMYVFEVAESGGNTLSAAAADMIIDNYENIGAFSTTSVTARSSKSTVTRRLSHIGRLNYSYADRYIFEGTIRYEASTNFAPGYRWGLFYSLAGSWRVSEETWFKDNVNWIENLKLRASYGRLGSDKVSLAQWRQNYKYLGDVYMFGGGDALDRVLGLSPSTGGLSVLNTSWEKSDSYNGGLDLGLNNGFYLNMDGYFKHTFDILDEKKSEFPQSSGIAGSTPKLNYGIQNSWGLEFGLGYQKQLGKGWAINVRGNLAYSTFKIIRKSQNLDNIGTWLDEEGRIGGGKTGYKVWRGIDGKGDGLARTWEDINNYIAYLESHANGKEIQVLGKGKELLRPGMLMFEDRGRSVKDQTPDGLITDVGDQCIISKYDSAPFNYGLTLGFSWKDLSVSALFNGSFGNDVLYDKNFYSNGSAGRSGDFLSITSNQLKEWYGNYAISAEDGSLINPDAKYPRLDNNSLKANYTDFWLRDGHNLRLRTLNVSYSLPKKILSSLKINTCRVFFTGNNLWTVINPYPYKDAYVDFWSDYPQLRTFSFGLNISL